MKRNIKVKTQGLTQEENKRIHNTMRLIKRRRRHDGKESISYEIKTENKTCVTR